MILPVRFFGVSVMRGQSDFCNSLLGVSFRQEWFFFATDCYGLRNVIWLEGLF